MKMLRVYKYIIKPDDIIELSLPEDAKILTVQNNYRQRPRPGQCGCEDRQ